MAHATTTEPPRAEAPRIAPGGALIGFLVLLTGMFLIVANSAGFDWMPPLLPKAISTYAHQVDTLFYVILAVTGFFFLLTEALLVYFLLRYRAREGGKPKHTHGNHALELAWTFVPGLILFCLAIFQTGTWGEIKFLSNMPEENDPNTVVVQVMGKQFEWHVRYPGPDGAFGTQDDLTKLAELRVPVNRPVLVKLRTRDVLHSFSLPNVRMKQDLLPGRTIPQWFEVTETGEYDIMCAELCGIGHTTMRGTLIVLEQEEYEAWQKSYGEEMAQYGGHVPADDPNWKYWEVTKQ